MKYLINLLFLCLSIQLFAQNIEPLDPKKSADDSAWDNTNPKIHLSFVDANYSLSKHNIPTSAQLKTTWIGKGWKNETINTQLAFWSSIAKYNGQNVQLLASDLVSGKNRIKSSNIQFSPIAYVLSDDPSKLNQGCGINIMLDSTLVADRIENTSHFSYRAKETRPLWLSIQIPTDASAGTYTGTLRIKIGKAKTIKLPYSIEVSNRVLPDAKDWTFHLDLWQNPYASARYYGLEVLSDAHLDRIKPSMKRLAQAGQKNITTTLIYDPWNSQTFDKYDAMIKWTKRKDGSWHYDYKDFDKWVEFMQQLGVGEFINCYSMIPWNLSFYYFDENTNKTEILKAKPGEEAYEQHWLPFLKDFAKHLKSKGWFGKTTIAMDERPMKDMQAATAIINKADKDFKISLAGYYHAELSDDIIDYAIPFHSDMKEEILVARKAKGYKTTLYTCCTEIFPNTFTSNGFYDPIFLMLNSVERGFDGYLRWAYDCWNKNPQQDTRFGTWPGGDTYLVYPNNETSIRFENMRDGIQQVEKIRILREDLKKENKREQLQQLENHIKTFDNKIKNRDLIPNMVKTAKNFINSL